MVAIPWKRTDSESWTAVWSCPLPLRPLLFPLLPVAALAVFGSASTDPHLVIKNGPRGDWVIGASSQVGQAVSVQIFKHVPIDAKSCCWVLFAMYTVGAAALLPGWDHTLPGTCATFRSDINIFSV